MEDISTVTNELDIKCEAALAVLEKYGEENLIKRVELNSSRDYFISKINEFKSTIQIELKRSKNAPFRCYFIPNIDMITDLNDYKRNVYQIKNDFCFDNKLGKIIIVNDTIEDIVLLEITYIHF